MCSVKFRPSVFDDIDMSILFITFMLRVCRYIYELFSKAELRFSNKEDVIDILDKLIQYLTADGQFLFLCQTFKKSFMKYMRKKNESIVFSVKEIRYL